MKKLIRAYRNWITRRTIKQITIEYLRNPNVNPNDYQTAIRTIALLTAHIIPKNRDNFYKQLEEERKSIKWVAVNPFDGTSTPID